MERRTVAIGDRVEIRDGETRKYDHALGTIYEMHYYRWEGNGTSGTKHKFTPGDPQDELRARAEADAQGWRIGTVTGLAPLMIKADSWAEARLQHGEWPGSGLFLPLAVTRPPALFI